MNRAAAARFALCCSILALGGCACYDEAPARARTINPNDPAYISMGSGDRLGTVLVENRVVIARRNGENNAYAQVTGLDGE